MGNVEARIEALRQDVLDGTWRKRHSALLTCDELDVGYRLIVAEP